VGRTLQTDADQPLWAHSQFLQVIRQLIGASIQAIKVAEDRQLFKDAMREIGLDVPQSGLARNFAYPPLAFVKSGGDGPLPASLDVLELRSPHLAATAVTLHRWYGPRP